jgi:hypothetical protein
MPSRPSETDRPLLPIRALGLPPIPGVAMNDTRLDDTWELYDVSTDVGPAHDLVADHPDKLKVGPASRAPAATETTRLHGGLPRPRAGRPERNELPLINPMFVALAVVVLLLICLLVAVLLRPADTGGEAGSAAVQPVQQPAADGWLTVGDVAPSGSRSPASNTQA